MAAQSSAIRAGRAFVELFADLTKLQSGLKIAEKNVRAFGESVTAIGKKLTGLGAGIALPLVGAAKQFADVGSELKDMSTRTGVSVEALSALGFAAEQSGTGMEAVEIGIKKMQKALTAGSEENQQAAASFAQLGLSVQKLEAMDPGAAFQTIAKRIGAVTNPTARAGAALQIFGKSGTALLPMIQDLGELTQTAKDFNLIWTGEEAKKADALGDSLNLLWAVLKKTAAVVGGELAPMLTDFAVGLAYATKNTITFIKANGEMIRHALEAGVAIAAAGAALVVLGGAVSAVASVIGGISAVLGVLLAPVSALLLPVVVLTAGLAALAVWLYKSGTAAQVLGDITSGFAQLGKTASATMKGIQDAFRAGDIPAAARILWAGVKVAWLEGTEGISKIWREWTGPVKKVFADISDWIAGAMLGTIAAVQIGWIQTAAKLQEIWSAMGALFYGIWEAMKAFAERTLDNLRVAAGTAFNGIIDILSAFARLWDLEWDYLMRPVHDLLHALGLVGKEMLRIAPTVEGLKIDLGAPAKIKTPGEAFQEQADAFKGTQAEIWKGAEDATAKIGSDLNEQMKALQGQRAAADERAKAAAGGGDAVAAAKAELAGLTGKAAAAAAGAPVIPRLPGKGAALEEYGPADLGEALGATKAKIDVAGGFQAQALRGLGAGATVGDEQLQEQKKTNAQLDKLNHKANVGRLVFN